MLPGAVVLQYYNGVTEPIGTYNLTSWSEFEGALRKIDDERQVTKSGRSLNPPLFRGLGNTQWGLETTLERYCSLECRRPLTSLLEYYRRVSASKPVIETLGNRRLRRVPTYPEFEKHIQSDAFAWLDMLISQHPEIWEYLVYLRHHGFPSPLLDWTASPYVAAFFAFDSAPSDAKEVCVYVVLQDGGGGGSSEAHLFVVGQYMRSHPRHFLQQCRYTVCVGRESRGKDYVFRPHQAGLEYAIGPEGKCIVVTMPSTERVTALKNLEQMNINSFSLFGSEDSLVKAVARRELLFGL